MFHLFLFELYTSIENLKLSVTLTYIMLSREKIKLNHDRIKCMCDVWEKKLKRNYYNVLKQFGEMRESNLRRNSSIVQMYHVTLPTRHIVLEWN